MFLCGECHIHGDGVCAAEELMKSYGKCENCGITDSCTDCKWHHRAPRKELGKFAERLRNIREERENSHARN